MKSLVTPIKHEWKARFSNNILGPFCIYFWLILLSAYQTPAQNYVNPVIAGDYPDPSIIRVGEDYYATATSGGWSPFFPILHSKDLVNWKTVGSVFSEKPSWVKGDFWAPEIIADKGRYFVYYTVRRDDGKGKKGTLCVAVATAENPAGPYTDKGALVCQEMGSLDAFFIRDENDKPFLIWKEDGNDRGQPTWLYAQGLDESGTKLIGKPKKLFRNTEAWEKHVIEGAYIMRRDGYFYMFYSGNACCGRACDYALGVARSKTLLGNWEKNPANPILAANETWQCPGHGSIVNTPDGRNFLLYHAYRKSSEAFNIGREALLDEVIFTGGWATINNGKGPSNGASLPFPTTKQLPLSDLNDEFNEKFINPKWTFPIINRQKMEQKDGFLTISPTGRQISDEENAEVVLAERTVSGTYTAATKIDIANLSNEESAGLSVYGWRTTAVGISFRNGKISTWQREGGKQKEFASVDIPQDTKNVLLRIKVVSGEVFRFSFSTNGVDWHELGDKITASYIEGARIALIYDGRISNSGAHFDWFHLESK